MSLHINISIRVYGFVIEKMYITKIVQFFKEKFLQKGLY